jgi:hypothetical protein
MKWSGLFSLATCVGLAACGGGTDQVQCTPTGPTSQFVANTITVPTMKGQFALDLNGDGKPDNQLAQILSALQSQGLMPQDGVNKALSMGDVVLLFTEQAPDLTNADCGGTTVQLGKQQTTPPPAFMGSDTFSVDTSVPGGTVFGKITNGKFDSNNPASATTNYEMQIQLPLVAGATPVQLNVSAAKISFTNTGGSGNVMTGQINGAIKNTDVQMSIIPNVAALLTMRLMTDPTSSTSSTIENLFDMGDGAGNPCTNMYGPDVGKMEVANDHHIGACEVADSSIIQNVLAPDIQMFDAGGNYKPNSGNCAMSKSCDSLSLGLQFTGVKATIQ